MQIDALLSTAMLTALFWSLRFLLPKAIKEHDQFVLICALLTAALALIAWLFFAVGIKSYPTCNPTSFGSDSSEPM